MADAPIALSHVVARLSRLVRTEAVDLERRIEESLEQLARASDAERAYLRIYEPDQARVERTYHWSAPGIYSSADPPSVPNPEAFRLARGAIDRAEVLHIPDTDELPDEAAAERDLSRQLGVRSVLVIPVRPADSATHVLVLQTLTHTRSWSEEEVTLLRLAVEILAGAIWRSETLGALRESEARFRALAEHATELISEMDGDGRYTYVNPSARELLGYEPETLVGTVARRLIHPEDVRAATGTFMKAFSETSISHAIHRLRHADGSWRWFDNTGRAYRTETGATRFVSIGRDITEQRRLEQALRESETTLMRSQKMDALGRLAGGVAHDFNNLLMVMQGNAESMRVRLQEAGIPTRDADEILASVGRAADLTRQLLAFGRPAMVQPHRIDLCDVVSGLTPMLERLLGEEVRLTLDLACEECTVDGVESQLEQIAINLVLNARDALGEAGNVEIRLRKEGDDVVLSVIDDGVGMDAQTRAHIFEPFFTTKEPGKGTGLGLAVVYGIAQRMNGSIETKSEPGRGSEFHLRLPASHTAAVPELVEPDTKDTRGDETVLLVEDEATTRVLLRRMLEEAGYDVIEARDGVEALDVATRHDVDLLVTDVVMPRMRGGELVDRVHALRPELPVLFISGYADDRLPPGLRSEVDADTPLAFLAKPFSRRDLHAKARALIDAARR